MINPLLVTYLKFSVPLKNHSKANKEKSIFTDPIIISYLCSCNLGTVNVAIIHNEIMMIVLKLLSSNKFENERFYILGLFLYLAHSLTPRIFIPIIAKIKK